MHVAYVEGTPLEFRLDLWLPKTTVSALSYGFVCVILRLAVLVQYRLVTDGRMDRQTDTRRHVFRGSIVSRSKNVSVLNHSRDITTFRVYVTVCDLQKSSSLDTIVSK